MNAHLAENGKTPALQGTGQLSENRNDSANHHRKVDNSSVLSPWLRCLICNGITHRNVVESTPSARLWCASCGSVDVKSADLRAEVAERRRLIGGGL